MFGWLKQKGAKSPAPAEPQPHVPLPKHDENGRPIRPTIPGLSHAEKATTEQKLLALEWAREWSGHGSMPESAEDLLPHLDRVLGGRPMRGKDPLSPVVSGACRALSLAAQDNRAERVQKLLPWVELRLGPQEHHCQAAMQLANRLVPFVDRPHIPLPGCDEPICGCWLRQTTKAEADKRNSA